MKRISSFVRETRTVLNLYNRAHGPLLARAVAFNLIVTAVPFIVIFFWLGAEFIEDSKPLQKLLTEQIRHILPPEAASILVKQIANGLGESFNMKGLGIIGVITLFWLPLSLFNSIQLALGEVNGFHETRSFFVRQVAGTFIQISLIILLFGSTAVSIGAKTALGKFAFLHAAFSHVLSTVIVYLTLTAIYRFSCRGVLLREASRVALYVSILWLIVNRLAGFFVAASGSHDVTYGILAGVVVLLTCSYFFAAMLLIGGVVAVRRSSRPAPVIKVEPSHRARPQRKVRRG